MHHLQQLANIFSTRPAFIAHVNAARPFLLADSIQAVSKPVQHADGPLKPAVDANS